MTSQSAKLASFLPMELADFESRKVLVKYEGNKRVVRVHLGDGTKLDETCLRKGTHRAVGILRECKSNAVEFEVPTCNGIEPGRASFIVQQAAVLSNYKFFKYIKDEDRAILFNALKITTEGEISHSEETQIVCNATIFARDLAYS